MMSNNWTIGLCCFASFGLLLAFTPKLLSPTDDYLNEQLQLVTEPYTEPTSEPDIFYFLLQPVDCTVNIGETATFSCLASTTNCTYRWQVYTPSSGQWNDSNINNTVYSPDLSIEGIKNRNGYMFRCMVTHGTTNERIYSNTCTLTVVDPDSKSPLPICDPINEFKEVISFENQDVS